MLISSFLAKADDINSDYTVFFSGENISSSDIEVVSLGGEFYAGIINEETAQITYHLSFLNVLGSSISVTYCYEHWLCTDWVMNDILDYRSCQDINSCGTLVKKPLEVRNNNSDIYVLGIILLAAIIFLILSFAFDTLVLAVISGILFLISGGIMLVQGTQLASTTFSNGLAITFILVAIGIFFFIFKQSED